MGFSSGNISYRRFFMAGRHPDRFEDGHLQALDAHSFGRNGGHPDTLVETGWIVPHHLFDTDFSSAHRLTVGRFVHLALRVDRGAAPAAVVASYRKMEEQALLAAGERETLSREERRQAREAADERARREARDGVFRRIQAFPLLIDFEDGVVYFSSHGQGAADHLLQLFSETFDISLVPAHAEEIAHRFAERKGLIRPFDELIPMALVDAPAAEDGSSIAFPGADRSFLGREFLAWLWFRGDTAEGVFDLPAGRTASACLHQSLRLDCAFGVTGSTTISNDAPGSTPEARAALRLGKLPTRLRLLAAAPDEFSFSLDGAGLAVSSLHLAPPEDVADPSALLEDRFSRVRDSARLVEGLYAAFLQLRLSTDWNREHQGMREWAVRQSGEIRPALKRATA